jgi:hypothetical protein
VLREHREHGDRTQAIELDDASVMRRRSGQGAGCHERPCMRLMRQSMGHARCREAITMKTVKTGLILGK